MLIVLLDEPGLFVFPTTVAAERSIEVDDADSGVVRAAFDERGVPYRVDWVRPTRKRKLFFGLLSSIDRGEYRFVPAGPPDPPAFASLLEEHPDFTNPPEAKTQLSEILVALTKGALTTEIYVALLNEGTPAWRPVQATALGNESFLIAPSIKPKDELWEFEPGTTVRCESRDLSGGRALVAVELVAPAI